MNSTNGCAEPDEGYTRAMQVTFHDVGVCEKCPALGEAKPAAFSLMFSRIGLCAGCAHTGQADVCKTCERDESLLKRRDLYGEGGCGGCQRSIALLGRRDRFKKGLPTAIQEHVDRADPVREIEERNRRSIQSWLDGG